MVRGKKIIGYCETERDFLDTIVLQLTFSTQQQQKVMAIANYQWFKMFRNRKQIINHQTALIYQSMSFTENGERDSRVLGIEQIVSQNLIQFCGLELTNH